MKKTLKIVVVGDALDDLKTTFLRCACYSQQKPGVSYPELPSSFTGHQLDFSFGYNNLELMLWDTKGQEDYDNLRAVTYADADLIILLFHTNIRQSFANISAKWLPDAMQHALNTPTVLIGVTDGSANRTVAKVEADALATEFKLLNYFDCDLRSNVSINRMLHYTIQSFSMFKPLPAFFKDFNRREIYPHVKRVLELGKASRQLTTPFFRVPTDILTHICDYVGSDLTGNKQALNYFNRLLLLNVRESQPRKLVWNRALTIRNVKTEIYPDRKEDKSITHKLLDMAEGLVNKIRKNF